MFDKLMGLFETPQYEIEQPAPKVIQPAEIPIPALKEFVTNVPIRSHTTLDDEDELEKKLKFKKLSELLRGSYR